MFITKAVSPSPATEGLTRDQITAQGFREVFTFDGAGIYTSPLHNRLLEKGGKFYLFRDGQQEPPKPVIPLEALAWFVAGRELSDSDWGDISEVCKAVLIERTTRVADYSQYTLTISSDPSLYGSECEPQEAAVKAHALAERMAAIYPGLLVRVEPAIGACRAVGPNQEIAEKITQTARVV